nr:subtilisin-like protease SBT1.3 [Tanacetum cinerariifolium]
MQYCCKCSLVFVISVQGLSEGQVELDLHVVGGKIVICDCGISPRVQKGQVVKEACGIGMVLSNTAANGEELVPDCHLLPAVVLGAK